MKESSGILNCKRMCLGVYVGKFNINMESDEKIETGLCFECSTEMKKKRLKECTDCTQLFCKKHIKVNDNDYSTLCSPCIKRRVHLEVSMDMEKEILDHKSELRDLQSKLKSCKKDLQSLESSQSTLTEKKKSCEKSHKKNIKRLESELSDTINKINWDLHSELLENLAKTKLDFKVSEEKCEKSTQKVEENSVELGNLQKDVEKYSEGISDLSEKVGVHIPYTIIRSLCCEKCKELVKNKFAEEIKKGYFGRNSIMASMHTESRKSVSSSSGKKHMKADNDSCNCLVF